MPTQDRTRLATSPQETPGGDRVREQTDPDRLAALDADLRACVERYLDAGPDEVTRRIEELEEESDMERLLMLNASALALGGLLLGLRVHRRFLAVPVVVLSFLLQHAVQGWCPPLVLFRRLGVRTRQEIDAERAALKAIRGDFEALTNGARRT
jgi:hypothetical protein